MTSKFYALALSALVVLASGATAQAQDSCNTNRNFRNLFGLLPNQSDWRAGTTNRSDAAVTLSKESEKIMKDYRSNVNDAVYHDSSTVAIEIEIQQHAMLRTINPPANYGTGKFPKYGVEGIQNGKVGIVLGLPVSGHAGSDNAAIWAKTDKYNVKIEKEVNGRYVDHRNITKQQSHGETTFHELVLDMEKGVNYKISYWRDGSAGPYGYPEGRFIELVWNGN